MSNFYEDAKTQAAKLPIDELRRHASIALDNTHRCEDCFICACLDVLENIQRHNRKGWKR